MNHRLTKLINEIKQLDFSFGFVSDPMSIFYLTGFRSNPHERLLALFVFPEAAPFLICPAMEKTDARASGWEGELIGYGDHEDPWTFVKQQLESRGLSKTLKIGVESSHITYSRVEKLEQLGESVSFITIEPVLNSLRTIKDPSEIEKLQQAAKMADFAIEVGASLIKKGKSEQSIIAEIEYSLKKRGISEMSFSTMVLAGDKTASPHGKPDDRQIREGDFVLFDLGVIVDGYCSDITRTFVYKHASEKQEEIYQTVLEAERAAIKQAIPGMRIGDLDLVARSVIENKGYGDYFSHRLGHGLGLSIHEAPSMSHDNDSLLKEGMVFTVEPGIYIPEVGGVRIEDDVYLTKEGALTLTQFPKELTVIS
ncbi:Xaa-Pro peptidase family protein [Pullulanibacillus sp. KACC 23026]|uniref:M24 family metallopeptidase n=1 Tax=Pullulanibacillus sp. KACC 23026 TaxID=3028315 RepID=UPI0023AF1A16|nr:Xaa-Pro peptidase family protein [Pullulanibacillus sp. KACC 23026]WEG13891.1 Xaa-Pro peptidase family protein [Pullulanibacillus sp. KACC 23026]